MSIHALVDLSVQMALDRDSAPYGASTGGVMQLMRPQAEVWSRYGDNASAIGEGFFATPPIASLAGNPVRW